MTDSLVEQHRAELAQHKREFWKLVGKAVFSSAAAGFAIYRILVRYLSFEFALTAGLVLFLLPIVTFGFWWHRTS